MKRSGILTGLVGGIAGFVFLFAACSKSGGKTDNGNNGTTDTTLVKLGNTIAASYQTFAVNVAPLDAAAVAFAAAPSPTTLAAVQEAFKQAYKSWETVSQFEFGPAADKYLTTHFTNAFPTDTNLIKANVGGASYVIDGLGNFAAQGFPALDYLLYAYGNDATLARFSTDGAKQYLKALTASLKKKSADVANAWASTGGNYKDKFSKGTGTDAGSSLSLLANSFVFDWDVNLQNYEVGIPIGIYGPTTLPKAPAKVEGYYSGLSVELLAYHTIAFAAIYNSGIADKVKLSSAQSNGQPLNNVISAQWTTLTTKVTTLPNPLSTGIQNNDPSINAFFTEIRKMTVLLKVDMSSALGIKISFQDDDGD
jgi:hypothetical protein